MNVRAILETLAVFAAAVATIATSPPRPERYVRTYPREYPLWKTVKNEIVESGCASVHPWIVKSGKQGFGLSLDIENATNEPCSIEIVATRFEAGELRVLGPAVEQPETLAASTSTRAYVPFLFDNEALWNNGQMRGRLDIALKIAGQDVPAFSLELTQARDDAHREIVFDRMHGSPAEGPM